MNRPGSRLACVVASALVLSPWAVAVQDPPASTPRWELVSPTRMTSAGGATLTLESDGAVAVGGTVPDVDTLTLECAVDRKGVTGFRVEALVDPRLPAQGPGWAPNGNFVLSELRILAAPKNSDGFKPVLLERPSADFEQAQWPVVGAIDGAPQTGWAIAPQVGAPHVAIFETQRDVGFDAGAKLEVTLEFRFGGRHTIGRLRLSSTTSPRPLRAERDLSGHFEAQGRIPSAIARGVNWLLEQQELDGSWASFQPEQHHGATALACYTLLKCGVKRSHPAVVRALDFMSAQLPARTYEAGLELLARGALEDDAELARIQEIVERLLSWQRGGWSYPSIQPDLSNTQFAALGLRAAALRGATVPPDAWTRLGDEVLTHQEKTGGAYEPAGFGYYANGPPYGSITAGGVAILQICHEQLERAGLSRAAYPAAVKRGLNWLDRNFAPQSNPRGDPAWIWYWLYGIERVGGLCGVSELGGRNWYREGATHVVEQQKAGGSWDGGGGPQPSTCFALLFLARATSSVSGVAHRAEDLYGGDDPQADVSLRASGDTPLTVWISSFGERVLGELQWPEDGGRGPRVSRVDYVLPGRTLLPDARVAAGAWRFSLEPPADGWMRPAYDDRKWRSAPGAFGRPGTPGTVVRTEWSSDQIWLRREFTLDAAPLVAPALRVRFTGHAPESGAAAAPSVVSLFDEEPDFAALLNESSGGGSARVQDHDAFQGRNCLAVTPQQVFRAAMPGWGFSIAEKPRPGEFRYLRFAWRKEGDGGIMIQIARDGAWNEKTRRFVAGSNDLKWPATEVAHEAPRRWSVVVVDLWKEFGGNGIVTGIAFTPISLSTGCFDAIALGRSIDELKSPPSPAAPEGVAAEGVAAQAALASAAPPVAASGEEPALDLYLNGTRIFSSSVEVADDAAPVPLVPIEQVVVAGRNVVALRARRLGPSPAIDVALVDQQRLASMTGDPAAACGPERFAARLMFEKNGSYELRARVHVRAPPADASIDRVLESAPLTVPIREALDVDLLSYAKDPGRNLIAQAGASVSASSAFDANWLPQRAIDGFSSRGWLSSDRDQQPALTIELLKPVRADTILVTPIQMRGAEAERTTFRVRRVAVLIDQGKGGTFEITMPEGFRKGVARLPKTTIVRRLDVRILDATERHPVKAALGLGEVELQLRK